MVKTSTANNLFSYIYMVSYTSYYMTWTSKSNSGMAFTMFTTWDNLQGTHYNSRLLGKLTFNIHV